MSWVIGIPLWTTIVLSPGAGAFAIPRHWWLRAWAAGNAALYVLAVIVGMRSEEPLARQLLFWIIGFLAVLLWLGCLFAYARLDHFRRRPVHPVEYGLAVAMVLAGAYLPVSLMASALGWP